MAKRSTGTYIIEQPRNRDEQWLLDTVAELAAEAGKVAAKIASMSLPAAMMTKETINRAYEMTLSEGILFERRVFHAMFATEDQKEGMSAFVEKRKANFKNN